MATYDSGIVYCTSGSGTGWTNAGNITANDDSYATISIGYHGTKSIIGGFAGVFSDLPDGATITGIQVLAGVKASTAGRLYTSTYYYGDRFMPGINLLNGATYLTNNLNPDASDRKGTSSWNTSELQEVYGGEGVLFSATLTSSILKGGDFKAELLVENDVNSATTAYVDYIAVRVYATYTDDFVPSAIWF